MPTIPCKMSANLEAAVNEISWINDREGLGAAVRAVRDLAEECPNESRVQSVLAEHLLYAGEWEESERALKRGLELNPHCPHCTAVQATYAAFNREPERALELYQRAKQLAPNSPDTLLAGINAYCVLQMPKESLQCAEALYRLDPNKPGYWSAYLSTVYFTKDMKRADRLLTKESKHMSGCSAYHVWMARHWLRRQQMREAEKSALQAVQLAPESENAWTTYAQSLEYQGKLVEAREAATRAVSINPRSTVALRSLSRISELMGDEAGAKEFARRADYAVPALARHNKLYPILNLVEEDELDAAYELAIATEAEAPAEFCETLRGTLFFICAELGKWDELAARLERIDRDAFDADCHTSEAKLFYFRGELLAAVRTAEEGHTRFPDNAELHATWIRLLAVTGQTDLLQAVAAQLSEQAPGSPSNAATLVQALDEVGLGDAAQSLLAKSLEAFPDSTELGMVAFAIALQGCVLEAS